MAIIGNSDWGFHMFAYAKSEQKQASKSTIQKKEPENKAAAPNQTGIPDTMKSRFENLSGFSFDDVRVHYNSDKPAQLQALAYTQGNQVYVAPGQEKHLGHELGHVVQQKQGVVPQTKLIKSLPINDDMQLERNADALDHSRYIKESGNRKDLSDINCDSNKTVQCKFDSVIIARNVMTSMQAAEQLESVGITDLTKEQIFTVLQQSNLESALSFFRGRQMINTDMEFSNMFSFSWFIERQYVEQSAIKNRMYPTQIVSAYDLEQTLDYACAGRWAYAGGYACLLWARHFGLEEISTNDFDIAVADTKQADDKINSACPTRKVENRTITCFGGVLTPVHRIGSANVLDPDVILRLYMNVESRMVREIAALESIISDENGNPKEKNANEEKHKSLISKLTSRQKRILILTEVKKRLKGR